MSMRSLFITLAAVAVSVPAIGRAQNEEIDFARARQQFVAGQAKTAANTLLMSSLGVRQQLGRCRDEGVGAELLSAEAELEKLANGLRNGTVTSVKALDQTLNHIDRVLAQHHLQLVVPTVQHPRADNVPVASHDLTRLAFHFERSLTLGGGKPTSEQTAAINDARKLAADIDKANAIPSGAVAIIKSIEAQVMTK